MTQYIKNVKRRVRVGEGPKIGIDVGSRIPGEHIHSLAKPYHLPGQIEHVEPTDSEIAIRRVGPGAKLPKSWPEPLPVTSMPLGPSGTLQLQCRRRGQICPGGK